MSAVLLELGTLPREASQLGDLQFLVQIAIQTQPVGAVRLISVLLADKSLGGVSCEVQVFVIIPLLRPAVILITTGAQPTVPVSVFDLMSGDLSINITIFPAHLLTLKLLLQKWQLTLTEKRGLTSL